MLVGGRWQHAARFQQLTSMGWQAGMELARRRRLHIYARRLHIYKVAALLVCGLILGLAGCSEPYDTALLRASGLAREGKCVAAVAVYEKAIPRIPATAKQERAAALVEDG